MERTLGQDNAQMHVDLMFPSKYLKAADLQGEPASLTIKGVVRDKLRMVNGSKVDKYLVKFAETPKMLVLNVTNARAIAKILGEPKAVNWAGSVIVLKPTTCEAFGSIVACIRVETLEAS